MSYDIRLVDAVTKEQLHTQTPHEIRGGTYAMGGTTELWLNMTYNYSAILTRVLQTPNGNGVRGLYGMNGATALPYLEKAIKQLGDDVDEDYWKPTEGNVKRALNGLLAMACLRPDGVFDGD